MSTVSASLVVDAGARPVDTRMKSMGSAGDDVACSPRYRERVHAVSRVS